MKYALLIPLAVLLLAASPPPAASRVPVTADGLGLDSRGDLDWIDIRAHRDELDQAAQLLEDACLEPRMLAPDLTSHNPADYVILARRIPGCVKSAG